MNSDSRLLPPGDLRKAGTAGVLTVFSVICGMVPFLFAIDMIEALGNSVPVSRLMGHIGWIGIFVLLKVVFNGAGTVLSHRIAYSSLADIRQRIIAHLKTLSIGDLKGIKNGELVQVLNHEVEQVELFLAHALPELMVALSVPLVCLGVLFTLKLELVLILAAVIPALLLYLCWFHRAFYSDFGVYAEKSARMGSDLLEYINGIRVVKAFNRDESYTDKLLLRMEEYIQWVGKMTARMTLPGFVQSLVIGTGSLAVICTGSFLLASGELSVRSFIVAVVFSAFFSDAIASLMTYTHKIMIYGQSRKNILRLLSLAPGAAPGEEELDAGGEIRFRDLSFRYDSGRGVEGIDLTIPEGSTTAVIGPSGSGKSTLAHLIAGLAKGYSGSLSIGGSQISRIKDESLSAMVALVQQDVFLFNTSIRENIGLGDPGADDGQIEDAARRARIHGFIAGLPEGYHTLAGEKGVRFSGGEKQRISIARMLLKDAPVVIFDEATSAVDPGNEALIGEGIKALSRGRTVIVIAHNMDMVRTADQIVLMKEGRIEAVGSHERLMEESPLYQEMVRSQRDADQWMIREGA